MSDDLARRLREAATDTDMDSAWVEPLLLEAADALERQQKDRAALVWYARHMVNRGFIFQAPMQVSDELVIELTSPPPAKRD